MISWQWLVLAIPALVLVVSVVMIIRILVSAARAPIDEPVTEQAAEQEAEQPVETEPVETEPVELDESFDALFVEEEQPQPEVPLEDDAAFRRPAGAGSESGTPQRASDSPS